MKINGFLYCYDACPCVMGWEECDMDKCPIYNLDQISDEIGDEIVNDTHKPNCTNGE